MPRFVFKIALFLLFSCYSWSAYAQIDSVLNTLKWEGDFRFRIEQDWDSRKPDGTYRDDRTRLRYRLRAGATYEGRWYESGFRIRTGNPAKQQDPQLTLGDGFKEFGTLPLGFEKVFFKGHVNQLEFWLGKNTFPFEKNNELFWSDNVFPEGIAIKKSFTCKGKILDSLDVRGGHFIMNSVGKGFDQDAYFQGVQAYVATWNKRLEVFPSFYNFKNIPNIPDGGGTYTLDYKIVQLGGRLQIAKKPQVYVELDYLQNVQSYQSNDSIPEPFKNQKQGVIMGVSLGKMKSKGDWTTKLTYSYLQQYAILDYMAQNDWARWDYSAYGSPDGRLSNFNGLEWVVGYQVDKKVALKMKYYWVEQLVPYGAFAETNMRIRFDLDVTF